MQAFTAGSSWNETVADHRMQLLEVLLPSPLLLLCRLLARPGFFCQKSS